MENLEIYKEELCFLYLSTQPVEPGCQWRYSGTPHAGPAGWL